jgi:DNA-binding response OmpR family regulator
MKSIIIAEDDPSILDATTLILEQAGYKVSGYADGEPLLNNEFEKPDLFLLDKQLSGVDGLDICIFLKAQARTMDVPVIMLSASPQIGKLAIAAGADDFLEKPFRMHDLRAMVARHID